jgi:hypothetical protein
MTGRAPLRPPRDELADATALGDLYLRRLIRAQLSVSLLALVSFGALLGGLPLMLLLLPGLGDVDVLGVPLPLVLVGVPMFPFMVGLGWLYQHRADGLDATFGDLAAPPPGDQGRGG